MLLVLFKNVMLEQYQQIKNIFLYFDVIPHKYIKLTNKKIKNYFSILGLVCVSDNDLPFPACIKYYPLL
jgi:hypothetical protein